MFHIQFVNYDAWKGFESFKHVMILERYQIVEWHLYVKTEQNVIFNIVSFFTVWHFICHIHAMARALFS